MVAAIIASLFVFIGFCAPLGWVFWILKPKEGRGRAFAILLWGLWSVSSLLLAAVLAAAFSVATVMGGIAWLCLSAVVCYVGCRLAPEPPPPEEKPEAQATDEWLKVEPSAAVRKALTEGGIGGRLLLALPSDISGAVFGERMLIATDEHLAALTIKDGKGAHAGDGDGAVTLDFSVSLTDITGVKAEGLVGGGAFEVAIRGAPREILRYSNAHTRDYAQFAKKLNDYLKARDSKIGPCDVEPGKTEPPKLSFVDVDRGSDRTCPGCGGPLPEGSSVCPRCLKKMKVIRRLLALSAPHKGKIIVLASLMLMGTATSLLPPYLIKVMVDDVLLVPGREPLLLAIVLGMVMVRAVGVVLETVRGKLSVWVGARITLEVRAKCFHHLQTLSLSYFDKQKVGGLMSRLDRDTRSLQNFLVDGAQFTIINSLTLVGISVIMFALNWWLALIVFLPAPFVIIGWAFFMKRLHRLFGRLWQRFQRFGAFLNDTLTGVRVVKAFGQEQREVMRFDTESQNLMDASVAAESTWWTIMPSMNFLMQSGGLLIWFFGGRQVMSGEVKLGVLMAFLGYIGMFYGPLSIVTRLNHWIAHSLTAAERIFEVLDTEPEIIDSSEATPMPEIEGEVEMKSVSFSYDKIKPVLKNVSIKVKPGEMIGLVGRSGAGKSTTINLICRLYDVDEGEIAVDGLDVKRIRISDLRSQVGVVLQETFLFSGTIAENIAYARADAAQEEIMQASLAANAHDFIMKRPDGYETQVGEGGKGLSGGEKQRISIARAILHNPRILILDEATSAVDTETERQIQEALARLVMGRTTFAIAHRLSTLRNANRLLVLKDGELAELGTHEELMEKDGTYAKLVGMQTEMNRIMAVKG